jgi:acyl-CoA reductase-like NAD-dependent aldehyde dehydrogenase
MLDRNHLYIGGRWVAPASSARIRVINAATEEAIGTVPQIGPLASSAHRERVESYIAKGRAAGARVLTGGGRPKHLKRGWFVSPTCPVECAEGE